jgi:nucleotide-binding universal stress UspA family protein
VYKTILVGTDGSDRATAAVEHAIALAKITGATLHIAYVSRPVTVTGVSAPDAVAVARTRMREDGEQILDRAVAAVRGKAVSAEAHNVEGDPADALIKVAQAVDADLVVVGNKGMSGVKRLVLGSVPNKVSHHCPCSLLIVDTDRA